MSDKKHKAHQTKIKEVAKELDEIAMELFGEFGLSTCDIEDQVLVVAEFCERRKLYIL